MSKSTDHSGPPSGETRRDDPTRHPIPPYRVVLPNNAAKALMAIVYVVMEITHLCRAEATHKMWEAHHNGRSELLVTHKERAELYIEQFAGHGLSVIIEPIM
jgi:ATP-dependent Clp protease adaptor protein ClpS